MVCLILGRAAKLALVCMGDKKDGNLAGYAWFLCKCISVLLWDVCYHCWWCFCNLGITKNLSLASPTSLLYSQICPNGHLPSTVICVMRPLFFPLLSTFPMKTIWPKAKQPSVLYSY
jgi:hypothetical protein